MLILLMAMYTIKNYAIIVICTFNIILGAKQSLMGRYTIPSSTGKSVPGINHSHLSSNSCKIVFIVHNSVRK